MRNISMKKVNLMVLIAALFVVKSSLAGHIVNWNQDNVDVDAGPYTPEETYNSRIFEDDQLLVSHGAVIWVESDVMSPGLGVVHQDEVDGSNCIMTAGVNPNDFTVKQCSDPFQTSKRFKLAATQTGAAIDLVFDVSGAADPAEAHRVFNKLLNVTGNQISDINIQLGFGSGDGFIEAGTNQNLGFSDRFGQVWIGTINNTQTNSINLDALFPFGLFGDADTDPNHDVDGYFDNQNRARFGLEATATNIISTGISANYHDVFGNFLSKSESINGYFWDHDDDDETDPLLIAHQTELGWFTLRPDQWWLDYMLPIPQTDPVDGTLTDATIAGWENNPDDYHIDFIEDLANINFNFHITVGNFDSWPTYVANDDMASFTLRFSSISVIFKNGFD